MRRGATTVNTTHAAATTTRPVMRRYFQLREGRILVTVLVSRRIHFSIRPVGHTNVKELNLHTEGLGT